MSALLWLKAVPGALKLVPREVWYLLAAALAWHFALSWHAGKVSAHDHAIVAARDAAWQGQLDQLRAQAQDWKSQAEAEGRKIAQLQKDKHDAEVRHNADVARDLELHGPGKAAAPAGCRPVGGPGLPTAAGGHEPADPGASAPADQVPSADGVSGLPASDYAIVPWGWLVHDVGQPADDGRAENIAWRNWYIQQWQAWQARLQAAPKVVAPR